MNLEFCFLDGDFMKRFFLHLAFFYITTQSICAAGFFTGLSGGKLTYSSSGEINPQDENSEEYKPDLSLQAFFAGQFNFSENFWGRMELSLDTESLLSTSLFESTQSEFQIDELSITARTKIDDKSNYFSAFMGTYDPIGSDLFLQRYFSIQSVSSKITESWLGQAGSILYPHFGIGISDVFITNSIPAGIGAYIYMNYENRENSEAIVFNFDLRGALSKKYFTIDIAAGIGLPITTNVNGTDVMFAAETLLWHAGANILIGNTYTTSLFIQAGLFNALFRPNNNNMIITEDDMYILFEPRFKFKNVKFHASLYSLPGKTVKKLFYIDETLGINFNVFYEGTRIFGSEGNIGGNLSIEFPEKNIFNLSTITNEDLNFCVTLSPYFSVAISSGELHSTVKIKVTDFSTTQWYNAFTFDVGYRTTL